MWFGRKKKRPPTTEEVAQRAIALLHVVSYALVIPSRDRIKDPAAMPPEELAEFRSAAEGMRSAFWANLESYAATLSPWERAFADTTMLSMTAQQQVAASWRIEAFQVLLWAVGALDGLPEWNERARHELVDVPASSMGPKFLARFSLRPSAVLEEARSTAEMWHWRSRTRQLIEAGSEFPASAEMKKAGLASYDDVVRFTAKHARESGSLARIIDEDFAVGEKAYRDLTPEEWANVASITSERHFALNWICGLAPANHWDETPTET